MDRDEFEGMIPTITILDAATYDALVEWLDTEDSEDLEKTRKLFSRPSPFTRDCE